MEKNKKKAITGSDILRTKPVLVSSAQNAIPCAVEYGGNSISNTYMLRVISDTTLSNVCKGVLLLLLQYGCRISEVLRINHYSFKGSGRVYITGCKGSSNRLLTNVSYYDDLRVFCSCCNCIGDIYSRFYFYRQCQRLGIKFESARSSKVSVTHAGRHLFIDSLSKQDIDIENLRSIIGHKSSRSTNCYVEKK